MTAYPKTWQEWLDEQAGIAALSDEQVVARLAEWRDECRSVYATEDADWAAVAHLQLGHPSRNALADRKLIAIHARDRYTEEERAIRVRSMSAREQFALAMGLGLMPQDDLS